MRRCLLCGADIASKKKTAKYCSKKCYGVHFRSSRKTAIKEYNRKYYLENVETFKEINYRYRQDNKTKLEEFGREYRLRNKEKLRKLNKRYRAENKDVCRMHSAAKRARKSRATPKWLNQNHLEQIQDFYWLAQDLKCVTGEEYHVDHIVPLKGKNICGLHVPWNLQVLPSDLNLRKSNKFKS